MRMHGTGEGLLYLISQLQLILSELHTYAFLAFSTGSFGRNPDNFSRHGDRLRLKIDTQQEKYFLAQFVGFFRRNKYSAAIYKRQVMLVQRGLVFYLDCENSTFATTKHNGHHSITKPR